MFQAYWKNNLSSESKEISEVIVHMMVFLFITSCEIIDSIKIVSEIITLVNESYVFSLLFL